MKKCIVTVLVTLAWVVPAQAVITFDFNTLSEGASNIGISNYMESLYPGEVRALGARVEVNPTSDAAVGDWVGNDTPFIWSKTDQNHRIKIIFEVPITALSFDGYVFTEDGDAGDGDGDTDFYAKVSYQGTILDQGSWSSGVGGISTGWLDYGTQPIDTLFVSNDFKHDIGIDNLVVRSVAPAPGALLLGSIGGGLVGYLRRRGTW